MKTLIVRGETRNLGDWFSTSVLLGKLREVSDVIDFSGRPEQAWEESNVMLQYADSFLPLKRYVLGIGPLSKIPRPLRRKAYSPFWGFKWASLFRKYDAVIAMPGPYANNDERGWRILKDLDVAKSLGIPFIFPSNSIGPLDDWQVKKVKRADLIVAREPTTHQYLSNLGIDSQLSADYAFLFDLQSVKQIDYRPQFGHDYITVFFRYNNLALSDIKREGNRIYYGDDKFIDLQGRELAFSTTDVIADQKFISQAALKCGGHVVLCKSLDELLSLIEGASRVISDRYHPCICGLLLDKETTMVENREPHKMRGLQSLQNNYSMKEIISLAENGLQRVLDFLTLKKKTRSLGE